MKPTLDEILTSIRYLPWKTVGKSQGVPYLDLINDLGVDFREAVYVKERLLELEEMGKIKLLCMDPPDDHHIVAIRSRR